MIRNGCKAFSIYIFVGSVWWWWDGVCDVFAHDLVWGSLMSGCTLVSGIRGWGGWRGGGWGPRCAPTSLTTGAVGGGGGEEGGGREGGNGDWFGSQVLPLTHRAQGCLAKPPWQCIYRTQELEVCVEATLP